MADTHRRVAIRRSNTLMFGSI